MTFRRWMMVLAACTAVGASATLARADEPDLKKAFEEQLPGMGAETGFEVPQQRWQDLCTQAGAPGQEARRSEACKLMAEKVGPQTPARARIWLLKQLERIGHGECVEAIAPVVMDKDLLVRDAAIRALANNPDAAAGVKLREAMKEPVEVELQVALINALGFRAEPQSVALLGDVLARLDTGGKQGSRKPAFAAVRALGRIATPEAAEVLGRFLGSAPTELNLQVGDALAQCGHRLFKDGKTAESREIAQKLFRTEGPTRLTGLRGLLRTAGDQAPATILDVLSKDDADEAEVAVGFVAALDSKGVKALADGLSKLPAASQVALLKALGARRDRAALPAVIAASSHDDAAVKMAALVALGGVGDTSTVPLLVKTIQAGGDAANAARTSLETVFADGLDEALIQNMKAATDKSQREQIIVILDHRRATSAAPALLEELASDDGNVRRRAMAALGAVASADHVAGMIRGLLKAQDAGERDEAGRAIALVCSRIADESQRAEPVLAVYRTAADSGQIILLPALGRIGGPKALDLIREGLNSKNPERLASAQRALIDWPDSSGAEELARLVETAQDRNLKNSAIHALVRVVVLPSDRSEDAKLTLFVRAMKQTDRNEERAMILNWAREAHTFAAVKFVTSYLEDKDLAGQACSTIVELLHRDEIRKPNQAESDAILDRVIAICGDKSMIERAKSFKSH